MNLFKSICLVFGLIILGQGNVKSQTTIYGSAPEYKGKKLYVLERHDYLFSISLNKIIDSTVVDFNGKFKIIVNNNTVKELILSMDSARGMLYVFPNSKYDISFMKDQRDNLRINSEPSDSTNILIKKSMRIMMEFLMIDNKGSKEMTYEKIKIQTDKIKNIFKNRGNDFFQNFIKCYLANSEVDYCMGPCEKEYIDLLNDKPVLNNNMSYYALLGDFNYYLYRKVEYKKLRNNIKLLLEQTNVYTNDTLKEIAKMDLFEIAFKQDLYDDKRELVSEFSKFINSMKFESLKTIAQEIKKKYDGLYIDTPAPNFAFYDLNDKQINLSSLKGKYVVINIINNFDNNSTNKLNKIKELKNKYNNSIEFITIAMFTNIKDKQLAELVKKYNYDWSFYNCSNNCQFRYDYMISWDAQNIYINKEGKIALNPSDFNTFIIEDIVKDMAKGKL